MLTAHKLNNGDKTMMKVIITTCALTMLAFAATPVMARDVADLYKSACTRCHGANGEGDKNLAPALKGNQFVTTGTDVEVASIIKDGRYGAAKKFKEFRPAMPAQNGSLSDGEIDSLVTYIKTDLQK